MAPKSRPPPSPSSSSSSSAASSSSSEPDTQPPSQPPAPPASAPKNPNPNPKKPSSSSSESDSDSGSDSGSDSPPPAAKPAPPPPASADSDSESDADSGSSSDSDSPPAATQPTVKSAAKAAPNSTPATPAKRKLPAADDNVPSAKKLINRVWSTDDEIAVLQGMLEFKSAHNSDPAASIESFHDYIKNSLNLEYSKSQISDKIRRLKGKYLSNLKRSKKGAEPSFSKAHEKTAFELSRQIWSSKNSEQTEGEHKEKDEFEVLYPNITEAIDVVDKEGGGIPAGVVRKSIEKLKPARIKAIEERWGKHFVAMGKMKVERAELVKDLIKAVVGILENSA